MAARILTADHEIMNLAPTPINAPLTPRPAALDHAVTNLISVFGNCALLPVQRGNLPDSVPAPMFTEANQRSYLRRLVTSNIAVNLGGHLGLTAIRFEDRAFLEAFLARNEACRQTLITNHTNGPIIWCNSKVSHKLNLPLPGVRVQMTGNVTVFNRESIQHGDEFLNHAAVQTVDLLALNLGDDADGNITAWQTRLTHGEFVCRTQRGKIRPKRDAWRDFLAMRLQPRTAFDRMTDRFYQKLNGDVWQPVDDCQMLSELRRLVLTAPVPGIPTADWCNREWLVGMLRYLRRVLAGNIPFASNLVRSFASAMVVELPDNKVTTGQLLCEFTRYSRGRGWPPVPAKVFQTLIERVLREAPWNKPKSKSLPGPNGCQNGFRGIALRLQPGS